MLIGKKRKGVKELKGGESCSKWPPLEQDVYIICIQCIHNVLYRGKNLGGYSYIYFAGMLFACLG
jgi:hypothetical protein